MKKLLLSNVVALFTVGAAMAQGYTPDASTGIASGSVGTAYSQDITFTIPAQITVDAADFGAPTSVPVTADVTSTVLAVEGLPSGLSFDCDNGNCDYAANATGTITISGTPTEGGTFTVQITSLTSGSATVPVLGSITFPDPNGPLGPIPAAPGALDSDEYDMDIAGGSNAVEELNASTFDVIQNIPNPFTGSTTIKFSSPNPSSVDFVVYDMLGNKVSERKIDAESGINVINFNAEGMSNGAYFYTITNGEKTFTKRMIIAGR